MQALSLKPSAGFAWIRGGWRLFRGQPFGFTALLFFYWLLLLSASAVVGLIARGFGALVPIVSADVFAAVGSVLVAIFTPALTVGFLQACRGASRKTGRSAHPLELFAPFRSGRATLRSLLVLGGVQMVALIAIVFATAGLVDRVAPTPAPSAQTAPSADAPKTQDRRSRAPAKAEAQPMSDDEMRRRAIGPLVQVLSYVPVALAMWYAPMLAAWHGLPPGKALFFSIVAVWRNLGAFVVYGLGWMAIGAGLSFAFGVVAGVLGSPSLAAFLAIPLAMLLLTWMYCSMYPTYESVFVAEGNAAPARDDDTF